MKLRHIKIQDFRALPDFEWDFTDMLGEVQPLTVVVGPNSSGKSSILDAIWLGLQGIIGYKIQRNGFRPEKRYVVRKGANYAHITYELEINDAEHAQIAEWKNELVERDAIGEYKFPDKREATIEWTYPAQPNYKSEYYEYGGYKYKYDWALLQGHNYYRKLYDINAEFPDGRDMRGGIYLFDQERSVRDEPVKSIDKNVQNGEEQGRSDFNLLKVLINLGVRQNYGNDSRYSEVQKSFNSICYPHQMRDVTSVEEVEGNFTIEFRNGKDNSYTFEGLSSGERSVLYFLTRYATMQARNAIVLIDELEMHLHPTWQRRLFDSLQNFGYHNQFIVTTHSPTVEDIAPEGAIISLGKLDIPSWQLEMDYSEDD